TLVNDPRRLTGPGKRPPRRTRLALEELESRVLLDGDPFYTAATATAPVDLTLRLDNTGGVETLRLFESTQGQVASQALSTIADIVRIIGSNFDDRLTVDIDPFDLRTRLPRGVSFDGGLGGDTLRGPNSAVTWQTTGPNAGNAGGAGVLDFVGVENLT